MLRKFIIFIALFAIVPDMVFGAQTAIGDVKTYGDFISQTWAWASQVIFGISVIMIIIGGIILMFAGGEESSVNSAKSIIQGAIVSTILVISSAVLLNLLRKPTAEIEGAAELSQSSLVLFNIIMLLFGIIGGLAVIALIFSSFKLITAHGDYDQIAKGKRGIKFAILGLGIAFGAMAIQNFVISPF